MCEKHVRTNLLWTVKVIQSSWELASLANNIRFCILVHQFKFYIQFRKSIKQFSNKQTTFTMARLIAPKQTVALTPRVVHGSHNRTIFGLSLRTENCIHEVILLKITNLKLIKTFSFKILLNSQDKYFFTTYLTYWQISSENLRYCLVWCF